MNTTDIRPWATLETDRIYRLAAGVVVRQRPGGDVQIGADSARSLILRDAPDGAALLLTTPTDGLPLATWWRREGLDPDLWRPVFHRLVAVGLLVAGSDDHDHAAGPAPDPVLRGEHAFLAHRHGRRAAARAMQARADALVVVQGSGRTAIAVGAQLAAAGVGHVHPRPDDPDHRRPASADPTHSADDDGRRLAALVRAASPSVRTHVPAAHVPPVLTMLAADGPVDPGTAAALTRTGLPHLVVRVEATRAVVGPLVLPGRTSCLLCASRHRSDADPHWPADPDDHRSLPGPAVLVQAATARAAHEALQFVDGLVAPASLDGTLEWTCAGSGPRRRSWPPHPDCGCRTPDLPPPGGVRRP